MQAEFAAIGATAPEKDIRPGTGPQGRWLNALAMKSVSGAASFLLLFVTLQAVSPAAEKKEASASKEGTESRHNSDPEELLQIIEEQQKQIEALQQSLDELRKQVQGLVDRPSPETPEAPPPEAPLARKEPAPIPAPKKDGDSKWEFSGYGTIYYENYDWETHEDRRARTDVERIIFEAEYHPVDIFKVEVEIALEHGGVGAAMEFDVFEEFGEFEQEIEKGGEVELEKAEAEILFSRPLSLKFGHLILPVGLLNQRHLPSEFFTAARDATASPLIPVTWHENGAGIFGELGFFGDSYLSYQALFVNGLDSTGFSSANWIRGGFQERFEYKVAEQPAYVFNVNYYPTENSMFGVSFYRGNTAENRPKDDVDYDVHVTIGSVFGSWVTGPITLRGEYILGTLENSDLLSRSNRRLSNNLGVVRSPVAKAAESVYVEFGYDISGWIQRGLRVNPGPFDLFVRYDQTDSMDEVEPIIFKNPRWDRESWTLGFNYRFARGFVGKFHHSWRTLGLSRQNKENTLSAGLAYEY